MAVNQTDVRRSARWALGGVDNGGQVVCMPESMGSPEGYLEVHVSIQAPAQDWRVQTSPSSQTGQNNGGFP